MVASKVSAQPHTTLCIQFLERENNDKKQYIAIGKTDLFNNGAVRKFYLVALLEEDLVIEFFIILARNTSQVLSV